MLSPGDYEKIAELRLDKLRLDALILNYNLKLVNFLETSETMTDKEKNYVANELEL